MWNQASRNNSLNVTSHMCTEWRTFILVQTSKANWNTRPVNPHNLHEGPSMGFQNGTISARSPCSLHPQALVTSATTSILQPLSNTCSSFSCSLLRDFQGCCSSFFLFLLCPLISNSANFPCGLWNIAFWFLLELLTKISLLAAISVSLVLPRAFRIKSHLFHLSHTHSCLLSLRLLSQTWLTCWKKFSS